jgi:hypothetical protein
MIKQGSACTVAVLGLNTGPCTLARQVLYCLSMCPQLFLLLGIFSSRVLLLCPGSPGHDPLIYPSHVARMTGTNHHTQLY